MTRCAISALNTGLCCIVLQDIELELLMEMYYLARYTGSALARIYIYVTPYEF